MNRNALFLLAVFIVSLFVGFRLRPKELPEMKVVKKLEGRTEIGVLSDTHIPSRTEELPEKVIDRFKEEDVDLIIHAGDLVSLSVKEELEKIAPVVAVCGNMDPHEVCDELPKTAIIEVNDFRIGVVHNTINPLSQKMRMLAMENDLDLIIFGHTHRNALKKKKGIYYLNPGSPTQPVLDDRSIALIEITQEKVDPKIINIED